MHARPFAHALPVWIGAVGSTDPRARGQAAADLIRAVDAAQRQAQEAYGEVETPRMQAPFDQARRVLSGMLESAGGAME